MLITAQQILKLQWRLAETDGVTTLTCVSILAVAADIIAKASLFFRHSE